MSLLAAALCAWVRLGVPDSPGKPGAAAHGVRQVLRLPGLRPVLSLTLLYVLAHNLLYTYIAPWLAFLQSGVRVDAVLLVFAAAALVAALLGHSAAVLVACIALWGLAFGGTATLFQTASARAAGDAADLAQSMLVTVWNAGMAGGGLLGAALLPSFGAGSLPWAALALLAAAWLATLGLDCASRPAAPRLPQTN